MRSAVDAPEIEPVNIPTHAKRRVCGRCCLCMLCADLDQLVKLWACKPKAGAVQRPSEDSPSCTMAGGVQIIFAHRIVKEGEEQDDSRVHAECYSKQVVANEGDVCPVSGTVNR